MARDELEAMEKAEVYTFDDIVNFARFRAQKSALRNDPWAWAYWRTTAEWASFAVADPLLADANSWPEAVELFMDAVAVSLEAKQYTEAAQNYGHAKWLRILSVNNKLGVVKPLSLKWLRDIETVFPESPEMGSRKVWDPRAWRPTWTTLEDAVRSAFVEVYGPPRDADLVTQAILSSDSEQGRKSGWTPPNPNVILIFTEYGWVRDPWTDVTVEEHNRWEMAMKILREHGFNTSHESINAAVHTVIRSDAP